MSEDTVTSLIQAGLELALDVAVSYGESKLLDAITGNNGQSPSSGQVETRQPITARRKRYGRVRSSGATAFESAKGGTLYRVLIMAQGRRAAINSLLLDGYEVTLRGDNTVDEANYHDCIAIWTKDGADDQTAFDNLTAVFSEWDADHRLRGMSVALIAMKTVKDKYWSDVYKSHGPVNYQEDSLWGYCYDPRQDDTCVIGYDGAGAAIYGDGDQRVDDPSTWAYSDNLALIIGTYRIDPDGYADDPDDVSWECVAGEADIADQTLTAADGSTVKRWIGSVSYDLNEKRGDVMQRLLNAGDAREWLDGEGRFCFRFGRWLEPTVHLTEADFISLDIEPEPEDYDDMDAVKVVYTDFAANSGTETESSVITGEGDAADDRTQTETNYVIPTHNQAYRVGWRILRKMKARWRVTGVGLMSSWRAWGEIVVLLTINGVIEAVTFEVVDMQIKPGAQQSNIVLRSVLASDFEPTEVAGSATPTPIVVDPSLPLPTGLSLSAVQIDLGATTGVALHASWDAPTRTDLTYEAQYSEHDADNWRAMTVADDDSFAVTGVLISGQEYDGRARTTVGGRFSDWCATVSFTPTADNSDPSAPSAPSLGALSSPAAGAAEVTGTGSVSSNAAGVNVYRATASDFSDEVKVAILYGGPSQTVDWTNSGLSAGTYYYRLTAFNGSGVESAPSSGDSVAVS